MPAATLPSRRCEWELLAEACRLGQRAWVHLCDGPLSARKLPTRLLGMSAEGVFVQPPDGMERPPPPQTPITVYFEHARRRYGFQARMSGSGRCPQGVGGSGLRAGWRLSMPERIEPRDQRAAVRVAAPAEPVQVLLSPMDPAQPPIEGRLRDLSSGGLQLSAEARHAGALLPPALFLARFELPGEPGPFAFRVQCRHCRQAGPDGGVIAGLSFCTDPASFVGRVEQKRLERALGVLEREVRHAQLENPGEWK